MWINKSYKSSKMLLFADGIQWLVRSLFRLSAACTLIVFPLAASPLQAVLPPIAQEQADAYVLYVAPDGSANNPGDHNHPLDSLLTACKKVDFRRAKPHIIYVRGG